MYENKVRQVHIEVTDKCNSECPVCPRNMSGGLIHPNIKNIQLGLDYFKLLGEDFIKDIEQWQFCGTRGDPMANTEIVEILKYIRSINYKARLCITTNGGIGGVKRFKEISNIVGGRGYVTFSVDGWEDTNHIYRKNVRWDKVRANMDAYLSGSGIMKWEYLVFKHNSHQIWDAIKFAKEHNIWLVLKEPFGFEGAFDFEGDGLKHIMSLLVYSSKDGAFLYHIWPETNMKIPKYYRESQQAGMGEKYFGAKRHKRQHPKALTETDKFPPFEVGVRQLKQWEWLRRYDPKDFEIDCVVKQRDEVFIDVDGMFVPCCFIASNKFMDEPQVRGMFRGHEKDLVPTETWKPADILQSHFFQKTMPDAMNGNLKDDVGTCHTCINFCGKMPKPTKEEYVSKGGKFQYQQPH